jgi:hypothetical protein
MKRYIKINKDGFITDIFHELLKDRFDGTEIYLDEVEPPADVWINGKVIFDELTNPLFKFVNNKAVELDPKIYKAQYDAIEKEKTNLSLKSELNELDSKSIRDIREWISKQPDCPTDLESYEETAKTKRGLIK